MNLRSLLLVLSTFLILAGFAARAAEHRHGIVDRLDHYATGFPLEGGHEKVACEDCHRNAVFKGTPRTCDNCHNSVLAEGKGPRHIPTAQRCAICHSDQEWRLSRLDHTGLTAGCVRCHNNFTAPGKSRAHPLTSNVCEDCHDTVHWRLLLPGVAHQSPTFRYPVF
jgi:hypothetical protein